MSLTFYYLFLFLLITTTIFQVWLTTRNIAYVDKNKTKVPTVFSKTILCLKFSKTLQIYRIYRLQHDNKHKHNNHFESGNAFLQ